MSRFIKDWLVSNEEKSDEAPVIVQDGETPEEDFSAASAEIASDVETGKPAVAEVPAASDDNAGHKTEDQGHQTVTVSKEDDTETTDDDEHGADGADETDAGESGQTADPMADDANEAEGTAEADEAVAELEPAEDDPVEDVAEVDGEDGTVEAGGVAEPTGQADEADAVDPETGEADEADPEADEADSEAGNADDSGDDSSVADDAAETEEAEDEDDVTPSDEEYEDVNTLDSAPEAEAAVVDEIEKTAGDVDALESVGASLEAYHALLSQSLIDEGGISPLTAEMVRVGLESLDVSLGGESVMLGMESFGVYSSRQMATQISLEGISTALKTTLEATKKAVKRLFELLYDAWNTAANGVGKAKKRLAKIKADLKDADSSLAPVETNLSGASRLNLNGEFIGNDPAAVKLLTNVTTYMYEIYPKSCITFGKGFMELLETYNKDGAEKERLKVHGMILSNFRIQSWETVTTENGWKVIDVELPGGWKLERRITDKIDAKEVPSNDLLKSTHRLSLKDNLKIRFESVSDSKTGDSKAVYTTPAVSDMNTMATALEGLIAAMEGQEKASSNYRKLQGIVEHGWQREHDGMFTTSVNQFVDLSKTLTAPAGPYVGYIDRTANSFISVLEHNLKAMKKAASSPGKELQPA